ncbi:hypothetical protein N0A02_23615 [Paraburkholderia acidicola]|uniref:Uncharacterized protein n=1 Tax=Paraburkholderia acidicola TaxID=1912599 RepID=A0ABV1LT08_9BURK
MYANETIADLMKSCYGGQELLACAETDNGFEFQVPAAIRDPQTAEFRSPAPILNELAIGHRLAVSIGRHKYAIQREASLAIKSIESATTPIDPVEGYHVSWHAELATNREARVTTFRSTLVVKHTAESRRVEMLFNVLPPSLVSFVRRTRKFADYADIAINREVSDLSTVADGHYRYFPSESDRLSDGKRVDHVPALTLIDIALSVSGAMHPDAGHLGLDADFLSYTDPRQMFDVLTDDDRQAVVFMQNDQRVAEIRSGAHLARGDDLAGRTTRHSLLNP